MDTNATNFAMEIESYRAVEKKADSKEETVTDSFIFFQKLRFGTPYFYPFSDKNIVSISVKFYNGESYSVNFKKESKSILNQINNERGWGFAKTLVVSWFNEEGVGYKSTYEVDLSDLPIRKNYNTLRSANFVYLLDRKNEATGEWNKLASKQVFELTEVKRERKDKS